MLFNQPRSKTLVAAIEKSGYNPSYPFWRFPMELMPHWLEFKSRLSLRFWAKRANPYGKTSEEIVWSRKGRTEPGEQVEESKREILQRKGESVEV
jgi:hypothetical protein